MMTRLLNLVVLAMVVCGMLVSPSVSAITESGKKSLNHPYYNPARENTIIPCSGATSLAGGDNEAKTWNFLISKGLTPVQAAGAMGNLLHEGHFEPTQLEIRYSDPPHKWNEPLGLPAVRGPQGQPGLGIVQWTSPGRKNGLLEAAKNSPAKSVIDLGVQLEFLWTELSGPYKTVALDPIMRTNDLGEAVRIWQDKYEVGTGFEPRFKAAQSMLTKYGSSAPTAAGSDSTATTCDSATGQVVGDFSLPTEKKWYDQNKNWFTKPHHDYPSADIPVPEGTPIFSMTAGKVILAPNEGGYGRGLTIDAGNGLTIIYGHGSDGGSIPGAKKGDTVKPGQLIMHSSWTGSVDPPNPKGTHLHLEIVLDGKKLCPQNLFVGIAEGNIPDIKSLPTSGCTN